MAKIKAKTYDSQYKVVFGVATQSFYRVFRTKCSKIEISGNQNIVVQTGRKYPWLLPDRSQSTQRRFKWKQRPKLVSGATMFVLHLQIFFYL